jgi:glycosyltransferase involved in cell wall biosynthesis
MAMVLLEAISVHARVICSDIAENREVVSDDYPYLFSIQKKGDLAAKIAGALDDSSLATFSDTLIERGRSLFAWSAIAQRYFEAYQTITDPQSPQL